MKSFFKKNWVFIVCPVIVIGTMILTHFISFPVVYGRSMESNFHEGDTLLLNRTLYKSIDDIKRYDVVVVKPDDGFLIIKRVIGLPGETLQITDGETYINGEKIDDAYRLEKTEDPGVAGDGIVIPDDCIFVMGDNRNESQDSRAIGPVSFKQIWGKCEKFLFNLKGSDKNPGDEIK